LKALIKRYPVITYVVISYSISWSVWFAVPLFAGHRWALIKVLVGIGVGPGLAAVLLDRWRGSAGPIDRRWCRYFASVMSIVAVITLWGLVAPEARTASELRTARPVGVTLIGLVGAVGAAAVSGFIFASAAVSRSRVLRSINRWRLPVLWWLVALFLPSLLLAVSLAVAVFSGERPAESATAGLPLHSWLPFAMRSVLFTAFVVGIGEEVGWRGWMLPELQKRFSPLKSSALLGVIWGFWHFPLFIIGAYSGGAESIIMYLFIGPLLAILFTWLFNRTNYHLLSVIALHVAVNNSSRFLPETSMFPVLLTVLIVVLVFTDRMWRLREPEAAEAAGGLTLV
jgi:CAAX protease family protein